MVIWLEAFGSKGSNKGSLTCNLSGNVTKVTNEYMAIENKVSIKN